MPVGRIGAGIVRQAFDNDLQIAVIGAMTAKISLFVGSCGSDNMV
jgi:hypothetical protein